MLASGRRCSAIAQAGQPCRATPLREEPYCFWHSPNHEHEAAEARRLGGVRRRREATVSGAYELDGLESVAQLRRVLEIATVDALQLENSVARVRALIAVVETGSRLLEKGELEQRIADLEAALQPRPAAGRRR